MPLTRLEIHMTLRTRLTCLSAALLALTSGSAFAQAAPYNPTAAVNQSFVQYAGLPTTVLGTGNVDVTNMFWLYEKRGTYGGQTVDSWLLFFDPSGTGSVRGTVSFQQNVLQVFSTQAGLTNTAAFQRTGYSYSYGTFTAPELSGGDSVSASGKTLTLNWNASDPGDYVRVMTAVPEPATYAQMAAGLLALGGLARRRRQQRASA